MKIEGDDAEGLPYIGLEHVASWTGSLLPPDDQQSPESISNTFTLGDVLFGKLRPYLAKAFTAEFGGLCSTEFLVLKPLAYDRRYLLYAMLTDGFVSLVDSSTFGAKMPRANWDFVGDTLLPLPPPDEQGAIAAYLDRETERIDALVAKKRLLIERLDEYRTALITRTVTRGLSPEAARAAGLDPSPRLKPSGVAWLGEVPEHWEVAAFSREVEIAEGQVDPELEPYASMLLVAPNHVESGTGRLLDPETASEQGAISGKYFCRAGDVIYSKIRPALAKVAVAPEDCLCSADMYPLRPRVSLVSGYLYWLLLSDGFVAWSVLEADRVAMPKINRETLGDLRLPLPPRSEQFAIDTYLARETEQTHRVIGSVQTAIERLQEYRTALITAAVTGKIDVRE